MPRKLKTYQTSIGFFDLAVAAPSMKAALEAWGSKTNLFHQGFAKEVTDPKIIAATMAKPGVVLRRAVGSNDAFSKNAALPQDVGAHTAMQMPAKPPLLRKPPAQKLDDRASAAAALAFDKERKRRERERKKEAAAQEKRRARRELAIAKAETALEEAQRIHETRLKEIEDAHSALNKKLEVEDARWQKQRASLEAVLVRVRE